ncbi:MAG: multiheme c-type cytochrome [Anaerolineae bacterium]|nr:multiheme c-type cytochrome [Anaerolineae bacterium]
MLAKIIKRLLIGFVFAGLFGAITAVVAVQANPPLDQPESDDCLGCHRLIGEHWAHSAHGQAASNQVFVQAWEQADNSPACMACHATGFNSLAKTWEAPGVECQVCHTPTGDNHPEDVIITDISSRLCGDCHIDTFTEWQDSVHGKQDLTCNQCHNAHITGIKAQGAQALCSACHRNQVHTFSLTTHAEIGLLCTDCHLRVSESEMGNGHGKRVHTFKVDLKTCTGCHAEGLHAPPEELTANPGKGTADSVAPPLYDARLQAQPQAASPTGFVILGTLVGVAFGMILAPWLENWFKRFKS